METTKPYCRRKNTYLKVLPLSKIIFQAFVTPIAVYVVTDLEKIRKSFLWENLTLKIKQDTLCNDYKDGVLKM